MSALAATLPYANYLFLADDARFPYGDLSDETLIDGLIALIEQTCEVYAPDLLVVACNTASTVALEALRARFSFPHRRNRSGPLNRQLMRHARGILQ